jgi:hypothetical protein
MSPSRKSKHLKSILSLTHTQVNTLLGLMIDDWRLAIAPARLSR